MEKARLLLEKARLLLEKAKGQLEKAKLPLGIREENEKKGKKVKK